MSCMAVCSSVFTMRMVTLSSGCARGGCAAGGVGFCAHRGDATAPVAMSASTMARPRFTAAHGRG